MIVDFPKTTDHCIHCQSTNIRKNGKRKDNVQIYFCKDCERDFQPIIRVVYNSSYPIEVFDTVISLRKEQMSSWQIYNKIKSIYQYVPSLSTIKRWIHNYNHNRRWKESYMRLIENV